MSRVRAQEQVDCFFANGLWVPGRVILLSGEVDNDLFKKFFCGLHILGATQEPIQIVLNSCGGSVIDGLAMFDAVSDLTNHVTILVLGEASSMGAVILQSADTRLMATHATLMLHDGYDSVSDLHCRDFERRAEESKRSREEMYELFANRTGKSKAHFRRSLGRDVYLTAHAALKEGLIDGIRQRP